MRIEDLLEEPAKYHQVWFWCRRHNRPELGSWAQMGCQRFGPFESFADAEAALGILTYHPRAINSLRGDDD